MYIRFYTIHNTHILLDIHCPDRGIFCIHLSQSFSQQPPKKKCLKQISIHLLLLQPPLPLGTPGLSIFTLSHVVFIPGTDPGIIIPRATLYRASHHIKPTHRTLKKHSRALTWPQNKWHPKRNDRLPSINAQGLCQFQGG